MVEEKVVTETVDKGALESNIFLFGRCFVLFVVDDGKGSIIIDLIGRSDALFIRILWMLDKFDCRRY